MPSIQQRSQYTNEDFQNIIDRKKAQQIGTGLFSSNIPTRGKFQTNRISNQNSHARQNSQDDKNTTAAAATTGAATSSGGPGTTSGGGASFNAMNITNIGSFQNQDTSKGPGGMNLSFISQPNNQRAANVPPTAQNQQPNQQNFKRKHKSIFSNSNFSGNPDNIIQDYNYTTKGSNENNGIAWEIKFNQSNKKEKDDRNKDENPNLSKSFKFQRGATQTNQANTNSQPNYNKSLNQSLNTSLHITSTQQQQPPLTTTNSRSKAKNLKVKLFKISQQKMQNQQHVTQNPNNQIRLQTLSPTKPKAAPGTTKGGNAGLVHQMRDQVGRGLMGTGQQMSVTGQSSITKYDQNMQITNSGNSAVFRRQTKASMRLQNLNAQKQGSINNTFQNSSKLGQKQAELVQQTFKKGGRTYNKVKGVEESPVNQTKSSLPAELIVMGYKQKEQNTPGKLPSAGVSKYRNLKVTTSTIGDQNKGDTLDPNESGDQSFQRDISFINEAIGEVDQTRMSREINSGNRLKIFEYQQLRGEELDQEDYDEDSCEDDPDFYKALSPNEFDQYISDAPDKFSELPLDSARTPRPNQIDSMMTPGVQSDVNPSANPSSSIETSNKFSRKSKQSDIFVQMPQQNIVPQQKQNIQSKIDNLQKPLLLRLDQHISQDQQLVLDEPQAAIYQKSITSRPSNLVNLESNDNESIKNQIKSCVNLQRNDDIELSQKHMILRLRNGDDNLINSCNSVDKIVHNYYSQAKPAQSATQIKQNTNFMASKNKKRQSKWSGGITTKTQMKFYKVINQNKKIRDQLTILKKIGISNESNSLFNQLVSDIKRVAKQSMTHSEIVNCIKASSIGSYSGYDNSTPNNHGPQYNQNLVSVPPLLTVKSAQKNIQAYQNSYGYESKDQAEINMYYNNSSDNNDIFGKKFKKSQSLISIKKLGPPNFSHQRGVVNQEQPQLQDQGSNAQYDSHSQNLNQHLPGKLDSDPTSSYRFSLKQDNFITKSARNQFTSVNYRTMEPSQQKNLKHFKNLTYLNNQQSSSHLHNPQRQNLMISKSKVYKSHKNLNTRQQLAKKKMIGVNQIMVGVKSERYLKEKYENGLQPLVIGKKGKIGIIGMNPAAINSVNPSSRVASRQDGKPFGTFLQVQHSKKMMKQDHSVIKCLTKSKAELVDEQKIQSSQQISKSSLGRVQRDQIVGLNPMRYMHDDESVQHERAYRPGEPGNPGVPGSQVEQPIFNVVSKQTPASLIQMNKKNNEKKKQMVELNMKSQSLKNYSAESQPSQFSFPSLPSNPNSGPKQQSSTGLVGPELKSISKQTNSSGDKAGSNYIAKYQKSHQVGQYLNQMVAAQNQHSHQNLQFQQVNQGNQQIINHQNQYQMIGAPQNNMLFAAKMQQQMEPVEYGQIIKWRQGEIIGLGSSSIVYSAIRVDNNTLIAVKKFKVVSDITGIDQKKLGIIKNEIQKYKQFENDNIVKFYGCELLDQFFCIYLEQMETSLANLLSEYGYFEEATIRYYTKQILNGLAYLHDQKIKHLDLKCSNILTNNDGIIKLCDFGSSREFKKGSSNNSSSFTSLKSQVVGSVQWMAPEVITEKKSGSKSDIWSLGCTIVEMFNGGNPWGDKIDDQNLFLAQQIITSSDLLPQIPQSIKVSQECEDFLHQCLTREYDSRPTAHTLLQHPWILMETSSNK